MALNILTAINVQHFFDYINKVFTKAEMEKQLKGALGNNEFYLVYQPQVNLKTGKIAGVEALIRWKSRKYGNVPPTEFIPVLEDTGLINSVGLWVMERACIQSRFWLDRKNLGIPVSVNVSPIQLKYDDFDTTVINIIRRTHLPHELLRLEITESAFMQNLQNACKIFERLKADGIQIVLDDFGTGYSSLNYIKSLPLNTLKIDKSFIDGLMEDTKEKAIIGSIIDMSHNLGLDVIAEGVERKEEYEYLKYFGCDYIQGFYFSRPLPAEKFNEIWIEEKSFYNAESLD